MEKREQIQVLHVVVRLAGLEPTASSSAGMRSIQLSYKRVLCVTLAYPKSDSNAIPASADARVTAGASGCQIIDY